MKHTLMIILLTSIIVLGGCQIDKKDNVEEQESTETVKPKDMEKEDLPDVRAFQDEFTRGFLQSTKETRPGYYAFLSGTGVFEMDFPEEGKIGEKSYNIKDKSFEVLLIDVGNEQSNIIHNITIEYYNYLEEDLHKDTTLSSIQSRVGKDLNFERIEKNNQIYYISKYKRDKEIGYAENNGFVALVLNEQGLGGIEIFYDSSCLKDCEEDKKYDIEEMYDWIMSVKHIEESVESDENDR